MDEKIGKPNCNRIIVMLLLAAYLILSAAGAWVGQSIARRQVPKAQRIKIYFYKDPGEYIDLSPVTRVIRSKAPARAAIEGLLAGPTAAERRKGYDGLFTRDFAIDNLTIKDGTARVNFVSRKSWRGFPGDIAPIRFKKAVELTLKQFPTVKEVIVSLDGDADFASEQ